jgi:hypothetical protein
MNMFKTISKAFPFVLSLVGACGGDSPLPSPENPDMAAHLPADMATPGMSDMTTPAVVPPALILVMSNNGKLTDQAGQTGNYLLAYAPDAKSSTPYAMFRIGSQGGAGGNGGAIMIDQYSGLVAAVDTKGNQVTLLKASANGALEVVQILKTAVTGPISVAFDRRAEHLYVLGQSKVEAHSRYGAGFSVNSTTADLVGAGPAQLVVFNDKLIISDKGDDGNEMTPPTGMLESFDLSNGELKGVSKMVTLPLSKTMFGLTVSRNHLLAQAAHSDAVYTLSPDLKMLSTYADLPRVKSPCWIASSEGIVVSANTPAMNFTWGEVIGDNLSFPAGNTAKTDAFGGPSDIAVNGDLNMVAALVRNKDTGKSTLLVQYLAGTTPMHAIELPAAVGADANGIGILRLKK